MLELAVPARLGRLAPRHAARGCARARPAGSRRSGRGRSPAPPWSPRPPRRRAREPCALPVFCSVGCRPGDDRAQHDEARPVGDRVGGLDRRVQRRHVLGVRRLVVGPVHGLDVPAVGLVAGGDVLGQRDVGVVLDRDPVGVVDDVRFPEPLDARRSRTPRRRRPPRCRRRSRSRRCGGRTASRPRRRSGRAGRARGGRPSPCRPRCRCPGRADRSWSRPPRCGRTPGGPGSCCPTCAAT